VGYESQTRWPAAVIMTARRNTRSPPVLKIRAQKLPSSASSLSLIFRDAASEISDIEKNALTAIRQSITKILFNISYPASRQILGREV
jgi:hypothetical protein